jgi:hypothetical protein
MNPQMGRDLNGRQRHAPAVLNISVILLLLMPW